MIGRENGIGQIMFELISRWNRGGKVDLFGAGIWQDKVDLMECFARYFHISMVMYRIENINRVLS